MTEHNHKHSDDLARDIVGSQPIGGEPGAEPLGPGYNYLASALKVSFILLKIIMVILIVLFLVSGFRTVGHDEQALVLRFGKIRGLGENRVLGPGLKWVMPYPIDEIIKLPVQRKINVPLSVFWYYQKPGEEMGEAVNEKTYVPPTLNPLTDGYCLVRGEKQGPNAPVSEGSDYNILHSKWVLAYQITDPESFFKNCFVDASRLQAGQNYGDIIEQGITPMLENLLADAVVRTMVNYSVEEAMYERAAGVTEHVRRLLQDKLDKVNSGIRVIDVQRNRIAVPRQVEDAFQAAHSAVQTREKTISEAKLYAEKTLSETAGSVANDLLKALRDNDANEQQKEMLWTQLAGRAQEQIADARASRTQVVESARADADYLRRILPEYRKHPQLVVQRIYKDAVEQILDNADEKIILQPGQTAAGSQIRVMVNRDPAIKSKQSEKPQQ
ncbi:MAG: SPFH domain-containing protein [Sedimentisphaerales bacterium]|jgi:membrane protease subunit HflK